jgi:hypothetical protein
MKQITYDPTWQHVAEVSAALKKKLEDLYLGKTATDNLQKAIHDTTRDYMSFWEPIPFNFVNINVPLSDGSGDSIWKANT